MPKLKKVKVTENSMSWDDFIIREQNRSMIVSVPKRELNSFLTKGKKIKKITVEFS